MVRSGLLSRGYYIFDVYEFQTGFGACESRYLTFRPHLTSFSKWRSVLEIICNSHGDAFMAQIVEYLSDVILITTDKACI